jgi:hypothetical protein
MTFEFVITNSVTRLGRQNTPIFLISLPKWVLEYGTIDRAQHQQPIDGSAN